LSRAPTFADAAGMMLESTVEEMAEAVEVILLKMV
jgi:hypothetical protein